MRKILLFKQELVVHAGLYALAGKESPMQTVPSLLQYQKVILNPSQFTIHYVPLHDLAEQTRQKFSPGSPRSPPQTVAPGR